MSSGPVLRRVFPFPSALAAHCEMCSKMTGSFPAPIFQALFWLVGAGWAYLLLQDAPHRTGPRVSSEVWAVTLTESSPAAPFERTQPTALKRLFVRVVSPRQPCVALKDVFTCYHTVSRSCKYDNLFNMQNVYFTEGPQTNWANIYRERRPKKLAFIPMRCCSLIHLLFSWAKFWQGNSCTWSLEDIVAFVEIIFNSWKKWVLNFCSFLIL